MLDFAAVMELLIFIGHILLEDIPGVGKTTLALAFQEMETIRLLDHDRPLILNNRDLEVVERIHPRLAQKQYEERLKSEKSR